MSMFYGNWAIFDIETTGFYSDDSFLVAIGVLNNDKSEIFFAESTSEEKKIIEDFLKFLRENKVDVLIGFNIKNFDIPYLQGKLLMHNLDFRSFQDFNVVDVFEYIKNTRFTSKSLTNISENLLEKPRNSPSNKIPNLYIKFIETKDNSFKEKIVEHLKEDLENTLMLAKKIGLI
jgi:uncharacterized protein YprB with RNaseH-like and TPR domain